MAKHFGFGEYERTDRDIWQSTLELRYEFLRILVDRKRNWAKEVVRLANFEKLRPEFIESYQEGNIWFFFFVYTFGKNPYGIKIPPEVLDTPLQNFLKFLDEKNDELKRLENDKHVIRNAGNQFEIRRDAREHLLPDWKALKENKDAQQVRFSVEKWAEAQNLNEEWCLDFIMLFLINFTSALDFNFEDFKKEKLDFSKARLYLNSFNRKLDEALRQSVSDFHSRKVSINIWDVEELEITPFIFRHEGFELYQKTWFPYITRRTEFIEEAQSKFNRRIEAIKDLAKYQTMDEKAFRDDLNQYCDWIEQLKSENVKEELYTAHTIRYGDELEVFSSTWKPSETERERFIENFLTELREEFERNKQIAGSLNSLEKDKFETKLSNYCNKVERHMPKDYAKTPAKYTDNTHFEWLVNYQIPPCKDYKEIAEQIDITKRPSSAAIKMAIKRLSNTIGLPLRKSLRKGRPKGIIETKKRHRARK